MTTYTTTIAVPTGFSYAQRETYINREIDKIQRTLVDRGFKPISFDINNKSGQTVSVTFQYK
jgi:hypothetical protein